MCQYLGPNLELRCYSKPWISYQLGRVLRRHQNQLKVHNLLQHNIYVPPSHLLHNLLFLERITRHVNNFHELSQPGKLYLPRFKQTIHNPIQEPSWNIQWVNSLPLYISYDEFYFLGTRCRHLVSHGLEHDRSDSSQFPGEPHDYYNHCSQTILSDG